MMVALAVYAVMPSRGPDELPLDEQGSLAVAEDDQLEPELAERV
jgi:hypothetical protein